MNNKEEKIRSPDPIKSERLIDNGNFILNEINNPIFYDINDILEISKNEYNLYQDEQEKKNIELICKKIYEEEHKERQNKFNNIKLQLKKIIIFDRLNLYYYELILSIIEMYEKGEINEYKTKNDEINIIFNLLKTIRVPITEINDLKKIIVF